MPVKRLLQGAPYGSVVDPVVVDDVSLMEEFRAIAADRRQCATNTRAMLPLATVSRTDPAGEAALSVVNGSNGLAECVLAASLAILP